MSGDIEAKDPQPTGDPGPFLLDAVRTATRGPSPKRIFTILQPQFVPRRDIYKICFNNVSRLFCSATYNQYFLGGGKSALGLRNELLRSVGC